MIYQLTSKSFLSLDINTCTRVSGADAPAVKPILEILRDQIFLKTNQVYSRWVLK